MSDEIEEYLNEREWKRNQSQRRDIWQSPNADAETH